MSHLIEGTLTKPIVGTALLGSDSKSYVKSLRVHVGVIGISFKTASIAIWEKLAKVIALESLGRLARECKQSLRRDDEVAVLSTCNRTEIYFSSDMSRSIVPLLREMFRLVDRNSIENYQIYEYEDKSAVEHLF